MIYYYGSQISPNKTETVEGFLICRNVPIARIGAQEYYAHELHLGGVEPNKLVKVNRYAEDVFDQAVLASFEGKPVTNEHPSENVSPDNFKDLAKGHVQNVRRDGDFIVADLYINDADLISDIQNGVKKEVSCGYVCNYEMDGDEFKQTHIRGNHVAVVPEGRAGHEVAIKDAAAEAVEKGKSPMSKLKEVLKAFVSSAKDAKPEELEEMVDATAEAIEEAQEAEPAEQEAEESAETEEAQDAEPAAESTEDAGQKDSEAAEPTLADLFEKLTALEKRLDAMEGTKDEKPAEEAEEAEESEEPEKTEEEKMEEAIDAICGKDSEESVTIQADEMPEGAAKDAAAFLQAMRAAILGVENRDQRARLADALLSGITGESAVFSTILQSAKDSAQKAAGESGKTDYQKICEAQSNAYASRNPHTK